MREGKLEVSITGLSGRGQGVGRTGGQVIFVDGALPGDRVRVRVTEKKKNYLVGRLDSLVHPSPQRVDATCSIAGACGACQLQDLAYDAQLNWKRDLVVEALARIGKVRPEVKTTLPSPQLWHYRNKAAFPVGYEKGRVVAGGYQSGTHRIVNADACHIQHPQNNRILVETKKLIQEMRLPVYDERSHKGLIRHVVARVAPGTGESMAVLVTKNKRFPKGDVLARALMERVEGLVSVVQNINDQRTNIILGGDNRVLAGKPYIDDVLGDVELGRLKFRISPNAFYQVNSAQAVNLYKLVRDYASLKGGEVVLDLYCGVGTIALFTAEKARRVIGIEEVKPAVADARLNAELNGIENVDFWAGRTEHMMPRLVGQGVNPAAVILDPPRAGCDGEVLRVLLKLRPSRIVYVSCYPPTLARDLRILLDGGYRVTEVQPVDMFPMTAHVETIVLMQRAYT